MPTEHESSHVPFNEQAALEELERLQQALEESRQKRKDASAAFDQFVNSFRKEPSRASRPPQAAWPMSGVGPSTIARESRIAPPATQTQRKPVPTTGLIAGGIVAVVAVVALAALWRDPPVHSSPQTGISNAPPAAAPATNTPAPRTPESSLPLGTPSELRALKNVWVRVTIDGQRVIERELDAGARVPLNGRSIVIRAGDPGVVRVFIDGQDRGLMGETGIPVTRAYTSAAASR
jgi:hypothetical protein